jgi:hypothetical protein
MSTRTISTRTKEDLARALRYARRYYHENLIGFTAIVAAYADGYAAGRRRKKP